jgi:hypothetical protein
MCRDPSVCTATMTEMNALLDPLSANVADAANVLNGSDQERISLDKAYNLQDQLQKLLTELEEQMVPAGYATPVPDDYSDLPQLKGGRATVEFVLNKPGGVFDIEGVNFDQAKMKMVIGEYIWRSTIQEIHIFHTCLPSCLATITNPIFHE